MSTTKTGMKRFQKGWRYLVISIAASLLISLAITVATQPLYRAKATFLVYPNATLTSSRDVVSSLDTLDKQTVTATYADIMASRRVLDDTVKRLSLDSAVISQVRVYPEVQTDTNILVLNVEGPDPEVVTTLANNIGQNGISFIKSIYQVFDITFLDLALEPEKPFRPKPLLTSLIAVGIGLALGIVFLILREVLRVPLETLRERSRIDRQSLAYNRRYFSQALSQHLAGKDEGPLGFSLIHLQGLDDLVETLPERYLTEVLQEVVKRLHAMLRGNDLIARWDQIDFSIMLPSTPEVPATRTLERLLLALEKPVIISSSDAIPLIPKAVLVNRKTDDGLEIITKRAEDNLIRAIQGKNNLVIGE